MFDKLKRYFNDEPVTALAIGAAVITAIAKLIDALSAAQGRRAYAKQVNYRTKKK